LSRLVAPTGTKSCADLLSWLVTPTGTKGIILSRLESLPETNTGNRRIHQFYLSPALSSSPLTLSSSFPHVFFQTQPPISLPPSDSLLPPRRGQGPVSRHRRTAGERAGMGGGAARRPTVPAQPGEAPPSAAAGRRASTERGPARARAGQRAAAAAARPASRAGMGGGAARRPTVAAQPGEAPPSAADEPGGDGRGRGPATRRRCASRRASAMRGLRAGKLRLSAGGRGRRPVSSSRRRRATRRWERGRSPPWAGEGMERSPTRSVFVILFVCDCANEF